MTEPFAVISIDLDAIAANWATLSARAPDTQVATVVKADAYGLGAEAVVHCLRRAGCAMFFTAHPQEAAAIQKAAAGATRVVLHGLSSGDAPFFAAEDLVPVLGSLAEIRAWSGEARKQGRALPAMLHIDTGMNRLGLCPAELARLIDQPERLDGIALTHILTHLIAAETSSDPINAVQLKRFHQACARLPVAPRSIANSSGLFLGPDYASDLARPGAALYGVNPTPGYPNPMHPVVTLRARVLQTRHIAPGERVGYNGIWQATRPSRIATLSVGYADGYLRALSNSGIAYFHGQAVPLVGRVSMDLTTFDITDFPEINQGSWLTLIGNGQTVDDVAARAGTNGYEILTSLGSRYTRRYHVGS